MRRVRASGILIGATTLLWLAACMGESAAPGARPGPPSQVGVHHHRPDAVPIEPTMPLPIRVGLYETGHPAFEPTIGATRNAIFVNSAGGALQGTRILRSTEQGRSWTDVGPRLGPTDRHQVPNSNDPFLYVDRWTGRVHKLELHYPSLLTLETSDDDGGSWSPPRPVNGITTVDHDHPSLASAPPRGRTTTGYANVLAYCVNPGHPSLGAWCATSVDGGAIWSPLAPGYPLDAPQCVAMSGHVHGAADGRFYRGNPSCKGPAVYRSEDGGRSWSQHELPGDVGMHTQNTQVGHEISVTTDDANNLYAFWIGRDGYPVLAQSRDFGATWAGPWMVAPAGVTAAGFPAVAAGAGGRVAFAYIGTREPGGYQGPQAGVEWSGFLGFILDAQAEAPQITTVELNDPREPLFVGPCGNVRCGPFGDFIGMVMDATGRPWVALGRGGPTTMGLVATLVEGPRLRDAETMAVAS